MDVDEPVEFLASSLPTAVTSINEVGKLQPMVVRVQEQPKESRTDQKIGTIFALPSASNDTSLCEELCAIIAKEYGLSDVPPNTDNQVVSNLQAIAMRSINRLSAELYSQDIHFLLELVQNADDNLYAPDCTPTLRITLSQSALVLDNNELGFSEANVRGLCNVGGSTKTDATLGYIGQKGIGFKSVFKVTPTPQIHSRQYHFQFDSQNPQLGYILPRALPTPADWSESMGTRIVLPLHAAPRYPSYHELQACLKELSPRFLLFLHRLQRIELKEESTQRIWQLRRDSERLTSATQIKQLIHTTVTPDRKSVV